MKGIMVGWDYQAKTDTSNWQIGGGQYWQQQYDPFDPFTFSDSHAKIPEILNKKIISGDLEPSLIVGGNIYPHGRMQSIAIVGVNPYQNVLLLPSQKLDTFANAIPAIIGLTTAKNLKLKKGDFTTIRWRDAKGMFDASEICIVDIFSCNVPAVEAGKIYIPLAILQKITGMENEATILTFRKNKMDEQKVDNWVLKTKEDLTKSIDEMIKTKTFGQSVFYGILLLLSMLAIYDTQVLSIFRRQKEIGTYIALGYTRTQVIALFTVEGAMYSILAALVSAVYGIPFLMWQAKAGWTLPVDASEFGMAMAQTLYPVYSIVLVISTVLLIVFITTLVSYWPSRKIGKMNPTDALRGKVQ
jgi:ABC-type lipoprotein release transport system permease subunit